MRNCVAAQNTGDGFLLNNQSVVRDSLAASNGLGTGDGSGISAAGTGSKIESNTVTGNDRGILVTGADNLVIKNSASGNGTNYLLALDNPRGPIVTVTDAEDIAGIANSNHPWANFVY